MQKLSSHVLGRWHAAQGDLATLIDPTSEEPLAQAGTGGIDFQATLAFGRERGGSALRALSFAARGELLAALAAAIHEHRDELIELSIGNGGCTRSDAKFDIDGATGTLTWYAALGARLAARPYLVDGEAVQLGRTARFSGRHVLVPRRGVALHVNAFNFPAWGMLEKLACAMLAGVPVIEKPGTATALTAWRIAQILIERQLLPEGAYQFVCGSLGDALEHLGAQDALAFTGSSATGAKLKGHAAFVQRNARINVEADSLNAAVLASDVDEQSETFALFLANVVLDMTQKTGQKCTAVRRVLVPAERLAAVREALVADLMRVKVGDPRETATRMGPLASREQLRDVRAGIERLARAGELACGGAQPVRERGCFVAPTLIAARDAREPAFHADEVFGPVAALLPYDGSPEQAAQLVNLGGGGLVVSAYSNDAAWSERFALETAPWHGRVWLAGDKLAGQSLPPGMVLPQMVHGGPGRAGGGEELGGERGLSLYLQRTAIQGFQGQLEASFGRG